MGWMEGMLSGFAGRKGEVEKQNMEEARLSNERESGVLKLMIEHGTPEIKAMAATALISGAGPQKRKSGLRGWLGEMEGNPHYGRLLEFAQEPETVETTTRGLPSRNLAPQQALMQAPGSAALPSTSPVEAGSPPPTQTTTLNAVPGGKGTPSPFRASPPPSPFDRTRPRFANDLYRSFTSPDLETAAPGPVQGQVAEPPPDIWGPVQPGPARGRVDTTTRPRQIFANAGDEARDLAAGQYSGRALGLIQAIEQTTGKKVDPARAEQIVMELAGFSSSVSSTGNLPSVAGRVAGGDPMYAVHDRRPGSPTFGRFLDPDTQQPLNDFQPQGSAASMSFGVDREALAGALFGKRYGDLSQEQQTAVIGEEQNLIQRESTRRSLGAGMGQFQTPADLRTAQATGVDVGVTSEQMAGQRVPTENDRDRRRSLGSLKTDLARVQELLKVLPSQNEPGGMVPGGSLALRRRSNAPSGIMDANGQPLSYRAALAQLEAVVDSAVNVLARTRGEQRGAQTERDAERAYNAIVALQSGILDPFRGDTQESAAARIQESLDGLDRIIAGFPAMPVPISPTAGAAPPAPGRPATTPSGGTGIFLGPDGQYHDGSPTGPIHVF